MKFWAENRVSEEIKCQPTGQTIGLKPYSWAQNVSLRCLNSHMYANDNSHAHRRRYIDKTSAVWQILRIWVLERISVFFKDMMDLEV